MDRYASAALALLGIWLAYQASQLPLRDLTAGPGPGFLPLIIGLAMAVLGGIGFLRPEIERIETPHLGRILIILASLIGYALLLEPLGYVATTLLMLGFLLWVLGEHRRELLMALAAVVTFGSYYVFRILLQVPLPPDPFDLWR